uniref:Uncharacterized protein n=1 Tax=Opuntia streptacantha TaxID=393608 RepID=A0A7C8ZLW1_OPUST
MAAKKSNNLMILRSQTISLPQSPPLSRRACGLPGGFKWSHKGRWRQFLTQAPKHYTKLNKLTSQPYSSSNNSRLCWFPPPGSSTHKITSMYLFHCWHAHFKGSM